jgi:DNA primase
MARISEQSIEKVRQAADIVEVVSTHVELKQRGRNFFGLCPFHGEKTPSFSVNPEKQIYKCFGCGVGGGSINFIMGIENLEFPDAIKKLAQTFNIVLDISGGDSKQYSDLKSQLIAIHAIATAYYEETLKSKEGNDALNYLLERGLSKDIIEKYKLGFSPDSFNDLLDLIRKESFSPDAMLQSGLFIKSEKGYFNRFQSRIMFPIQNQNGDVIAFGGRIFNKDNPAKYLNSPETPIYLKSNVLYGINHNVKSIRENKSIILVEGYMDLLQLVNADIHNCLAISGTAFTEGHSNILKRFTKNIYVAFDGDDAGKKAALKCGYILSENSLESRIITPPNGLDPDDWVRQDKGKSFQEAIKNGQKIIKSHYNYFSSIHSEGSLNIHDFIQECLDQLVNINNPIILELMIKELSELTSIDYQNIYHVLKEKINKRNRYKNPDKMIEDDLKEVTLNQKYSLKLYDDLIRICFAKEKNIRLAIFEYLDPSWILSTEHKYIYEKIYIHLKSEENPPVSIIAEQIEDKKIREKFIDLTFDLEKFNPEYNMAIDCLIRLEQDVLKDQINSLRNMLKESNDNRDILTQLLNLEKNISNISEKYDSK